METMIVTGGAGFIGSNFVHFALNNTDARVVVVDKLTYAGNLQNLADVEQSVPSRYHFVEADIADGDAMESLFRTWQPNSVINFAAETHVDRSIDGPRPFVVTNVLGTVELLEAARRQLERSGRTAAEDFRFVHVSTDEVYGSLGETDLFAETTPYAPNSPYAASKAAADHFVRAYYETYKFPAVITNCSNNYGPFQFPEKLIPLVILNARDGRELPIYGDGRNVRDWLYVDDHCSGILLALRKGKAGEKYNIGGGNEYTNLQIVDKICELLGEYLPPAQNDRLTDDSLTDYKDLKRFVADRPGHDRRYAMDAEKIRQDLGWEARLNFDEGIARTVRWYLENSKWCEDVQSGNYRRERLGLTAGKELAGDGGGDAQ